MEGLGRGDALGAGSIQCDDQDPLGHNFLCNGKGMGTAPGVGPQFYVDEESKYLCSYGNSSAPGVGNAFGEGNG